MKISFEFISYFFEYERFKLDVLFFARHPVFFYCCTENNVNVSLYFAFNSKQRKGNKMFFYGVRLNYATTHHDLPQSASPHHQPKYIHRHPPPAKIYPPPHTTTQKMDQNIFIYNLLLTLL